MNNKPGYFFVSALFRTLIISLFIGVSGSVMALELTPEEAQMKQKAEDAFAASNISEAMGYYARLHHTYPEDDELEYKLARCYYLMGVYNYAIRHANNLIARNPQSIDALMILVNVSLSNNHLGEAKAFLLSILSIDSHHAEAWRLLSDVLSREGDLAGAEDASAKYLQYKQ